METMIRNDAGIKRLGFRNFIGAVWVLLRMNRNCKRTRCHTKFEIVLPIRWL